MALRKREELEAREAVDVARMARKSAGSLFYTASIIAAMLLVLILSTAVRKTWDLSITDSNSLSPQTVSLLESLEHDVRIYPFYARQDETRWEQYQILLDRYRDVTSRIKVEFVDPVEQPGKVADLGLNPQEIDLRGGLTLVVRDEDHRITYRGMEEENITNAILEVGRDTRRVVGFVRGYGERDIRSDVGGGYAKFTAALLQEYYDVLDVNLGRGIPHDVTVLVAPGPVQPIPPDHLATLDAWIADGGRLLALLDPGEATGLGLVLENWGLRATGNQVFDTLHNVNQTPSFLRIESFSGHAAVEGFGKRLPLALAVAGAVEHFETGEGLLYHDDLALSSDVSFLLEEDGSRGAGPFAVAAASWLARPGPDGGAESRVIVVGDSDFASNAYLAAHANRNFVLNCVGWLSRQKDLISIRQRRLAGQILDMTPGQQVRSGIWVAAPPLLIVLAGIVVAFRRRGK